MHKLHKITVFEQFSGLENVLFVDPSDVNNVSEVTIDVNEPKLNTRERKKVKATLFASGRTWYHTLMRSKN